MKNIFYGIVLVTLGLSQTLNLMPVPEKIQVREGKYYISGSFSVVLKGVYHERLQKAVRRTLFRIDSKTGLNFSKYINGAKSPSLVITSMRKGIVKLHEDESYTLKISKAGLLLDATTDIGALRGLETLVQLLTHDEKGYYFPYVSIKDTPRFPWRGLLIDVARHFHPVDVIKRNLDAMAAVKMNVLHLHLTEDQGFRIESKRFPKLHEMGSNGFYFTQEQIKDLIQYADSRGIRIMPEFDIPGHTTSWFVGHPELATIDSTYKIETGFGVFDPAIDPTKESTYTFLESFIDEMTALFPDEYFHIGGDENNGKHWNRSPSVQAFMKKHKIKDNHALQAYFNKRLLKLITKNGKKMVGWDEIFQPDLPKDIVIHSWRGKDALIKSAKRGYQTMLSNGYYIDLAKTTEKHYLNDPITPEMKLTKKEKSFILGGEATMWSELVSSETVDSRIWPRTAAIAERLWSPQSVKDVDDMYRRLEVISLQLENLGLTHIKNREMMMRRLLGHRNIESLKVFLEVIEPVKIYKRHWLGVKYSTHLPLTRIPDIATPDSKAARVFKKKMNQFVKTNDKKLGNRLIKMLERWSENHKTLSFQIDQTPVLKPIKSLSKDLMDVSNEGIFLIKYKLGMIKTFKAPDINRYIERFKEAKKPRMESEIMIIPSLIKLAESMR